MLPVTLPASPRCAPLAAPEYPTSLTKPSEARPWVAVTTAGGPAGAAVHLPASPQGELRRPPPREAPGLAFHLHASAHPCSEARQRSWCLAVAQNTLYGLSAAGALAGFGLLIASAAPGQADKTGPGFIVLFSSVMLLPCARMLPILPCFEASAGDAVAARV